MKKIIRLTESDLARIVKRVLKESTEEPIKVKVFSVTDKNMTQRSCNIEATKLGLHGTYIDFNYKIPGNGFCFLDHENNDIKEIPTIGKAQIFCGDWKSRTIEFTIEETEEDRMAISGFLSKEGYAKLSKKCDEYASVDADDMNNDFV